MSNQKYVDVVYNEKDKPFTDYNKDDKIFN